MASLRGSEPWLVTGASGFLGRTLCAALVARGVPVRALVRRAAAAPPGSEPHIVRGLDDAEGLAAALRGAGTVVHLAARVHQMDDPAPDPLAEFRAVNVDGLRRVLRQALAARVARFVFVSSTKAVGEATEQPWTETEPPRPSDAYGVSKLEAEQVVRELAERGGLHAPILRLPLAYGAGAKGNILRLFEAVDRGAPLPFALVRNRRSLLFAGNFVAAVDAVLASPSAGSETFFVSDGHDLSTPELIRSIGLALGRRPRLLPVPPAAFRAAARLGDAMSRRFRVPFDSAVERRLLGSLAVDISKLRRLTSYAPPFTPAAGLSVMAAWYLGQVRAP